MKPKGAPTNGRCVAGVTGFMGRGAGNVSVMCNNNLGRSGTRVLTSVSRVSNNLVTLAEFRNRVKCCPRRCLRVVHLCVNERGGGWTCVVGKSLL